MKFVVLFGRIVLGAIFLVFGLNKLIPLFAVPPPGGTAAEFMGGLVAAGYFFPLLAIVEITAGLLLLIGRFVPLALALLAPVTLHILAFHLFLAPGGLPLAILLVALDAGLAWLYRDAFRGMLRSDADWRFRRPAHTERPAHRRRHGPHEPAEA